MKHRLQPSDHNPDPEEAADAQPSSGSEPSWFLDPANDSLRDELTARYRQSRNLPDPTQRPVQSRENEPWQPKDWIETHPRPPLRYLQNRREPELHRALKRTARPRAEPGVAGTFAAAALLAGFCGAAAGFLNANIEPLKSAALALVARSPVAATVAEPQMQLRTVTETVISKKPVATATLDVRDVAGETNSLIPLALHAEPALLGQDLLLQISGLPENAYLTSGRKTDHGWTLATDDLKNLKLMIPAGNSSQVDVAVAAYERKSGELAAPVKSMTIALSDVVVQPVSAPPPGAIPTSTLKPPVQGQLAAIPHPTSTGMDINSTMEAAVAKTHQADGLLSKGDIAGARKLYTEAWTQGIADGAYGMGRSFDPVALAMLKLGKPDSDSAMAIQWYERAAMAGKTEAISAIVRLRLKPS